jgi:hypothetical protein
MKVAVQQAARSVRGSIELNLDGKVKALPGRTMADDKGNKRCS